MTNNSIPAIGTRNLNEIGNYKNIWSFDKENNWTKPTTLQPKIGYWINSLEEEKEVYFDEEGYKINFNDLSDGWHLLGSGEKITNLHTTSGIEVVYTFDGYLSKWSKNPTTINAGQGFWVKKD